MVIQGGVTAPKGFQAAAAKAGIKKEDRLDMAMIYSTTPALSAGTFTKNRVKAAPVLWDRELVYHRQTARAVVCNSGIANACTSEEGMACCRRTAAAAAGLLGIEEEDVFVASTGVIGFTLPMEKIEKGVADMVPALSAGEAAADMAANAILTTDTHKKEIAVSFPLDGKDVVIGGCCKGSGMIHPNMCTMLAFLTTDVSITKDLLQKALSDTVQDTFNMVSVDGDTSTNDTVLLLANGQAENAKITEEGDAYMTFCHALNTAAVFLAKSIAGDGEGATKLFEVKITGAKTKQDAVTLSKAVVSSNLTKAAIYGSDANWGRILCAMGYSGADFDPDKTDLLFESEAGKIQILKDGKAVPFDEEAATEILSCSAVTAAAELHQGEGSATAWGCDLTYDYVKINADYRS